MRWFNCAESAADSRWKRSRQCVKPNRSPKFDKIEVKSLRALIARTEGSLGTICPSGSKGGGKGGAEMEDGGASGSSESSRGAEGVGGTAGRGSRMKSIFRERISTNCRPVM